MDLSTVCGKESGLLLAHLTRCVDLQTVMTVSCVFLGTIVESRLLSVSTQHQRTLSTRLNKNWIVAYASYSLKIKLKKLVF